MRCLIRLTGDSCPTVITVDCMTYDDEAQVLWIVTVGGDSYTIKMSDFDAKTAIRALYRNGFVGLDEFDAVDEDADDEIATD